MAKSETIYGLHAVASVLANDAAHVSSVAVLDSRDDERLGSVVAAATAAGVRVLRLSRKELDRMLPAGARHQGVIATVLKTTQPRERDLPAFLRGLEGPAFLLVLDGIQDPHNLGACLRTADAAGVHAVIMPRDRAVGITPVVRKVASGAVDSVPVFTVTNLARVLRQLREAGVWIYGASDDAGQDVYATDLNGPLALVLGAEGKGLRRLTREHCDALLAIPMAGQVTSLNVSVATGILLYEARRQRQGLSGQDGIR